MSKEAPAPAEYVGVVCGSAAGEVGERVGAGALEWARRRGLGPEARMSAVVVLTVDANRARALRRVVEAIAADPVAASVTSWIAARCVMEPALTALTLDLHADFSTWLATQQLYTASVRVFALRLRGLGVKRWRDPWTRRQGFRGIALKTAATGGSDVSAVTDGGGG